MYALCCVGSELATPHYLTWAVELAATAHRAFVYHPAPGGGPRMYWKMSVDLSRPLVEAMGQHDPLDGLITYRELDRAAISLGTERPHEADLAELELMCGCCRWETDDALGLGGLLTDAYRLAQLGCEHDEDQSLLYCILNSALRGLQRYRERGAIYYPAHARLAFRELGLAIGLSAGERLMRMTSLRRRLSPALDGLLSELSSELWLRDEILVYWLHPSHRESASWRAHAEINDVMFATSLLPETFISVYSEPPQSGLTQNGDTR